MQSATQNAAPNAQTGNVSQISWQFVVQYYTYMNDKPDQLHRFYTKNSHYIHGVEGEETTLLQGQTAIHKKFMEIDFKDCKTFIHSVDAHPSANNGIMVHVIGEMSNKGEPWKKFVQAFFLAEQQNGYFVLNDNFRFLKEESFGDEEEEVEDTPVADPTATVGQPSAPVQDLSQNSYLQTHTNGYHHAAPVETAAPAHSPAAVPPPVPIAQAPAPSAAVPPVPVPAVAEPEPELARLPTPSPDPTPAPSIPEVVEPPQEKATSPAPTMPSPAGSRQSPSPAPPSPATAAAEPVQQSTKPATAPPPASTSPSQPPTAPAAPSAPKSWARLAATDSARWGQNVAQEAKGVSAAAPLPPVHTPAPTTAAAQPPRERPSGGASGAAGADPTLQAGGVGPRNIPPAQQHPLYAAALAATTPLCFIKGVTENIPQNALEQILTTRFGPIKECEIVRSKACAFLEFRSIDSAKRAIIASLHPNAGGEGGIRLDEEKYGSPARINVETRKERGERPAPRPRGGMPGGGGEGRGSMGPGGPSNQAGGYRTAGGGGSHSGGALQRASGSMRGRGDGGRGGKP